MSYLIDEIEYASIDGVPLSTPAWKVTSLAELWSSPILRGADVIIPAAAGVRSWPWRATATPVELTINIVGDTDWTGATNANLRSGLQANCDHLRQALIDLPTDADGTRTLLLVMPDRSVRTGSVRIERLRFTPLGDWGASAQLTMTITSGALVASS